MIGIVMATHGSLAEGLKSGIELLVGPQTDFEVLGLYHGDDPEAFENDVVAAIKRVDSGAGVLCLCDVLGGTPSNVLMRHLDMPNVHAIAGANLPMAIQAVFMRETMELEPLAAEVVKAGNESIVDLNDRLRGVAPKTPEKIEHEQEKTVPGDAPAIPLAPSVDDGAPAAGKGEVVLCRVDDRLIHGQVMTSWLNATGANKIMIVDDETAQNPFLKTVFKGTVPANVGIGVFNEKKAADRLIKGFGPNDRVIVLAKFPQTFLSLVDKGASIGEVIIGGMGLRGERKKFYRNISASEAEKGVFRELIDRGVDVEIQILADDARTNVGKLL